jgi:peptide-methionine (S)-S-oxide reductase
MGRRNAYQIGRGSIRAGSYQLSAVLTPGQTTRVMSLPSGTRIRTNIRMGAPGTGIYLRVAGFFGGMGNALGGGPWAFGGGAGGNPRKWKHEPESNQELATFGAGCYWGTEKFFATEFAEKHPGAILGTSVGFMHPSPNAAPNPTYRQVCSGDTGYVEVAHVLFDSSKVQYEELVRFFYTFHDPTTRDRQGNDAGSQYASVIFVHSDEQRQAAKAVSGKLDALMSEGKLRVFSSSKVVTQVHKANPYVPAELDHQRYLETNSRGYCNHGKYFEWEDIK